MRGKAFGRIQTKDLFWKLGVGNIKHNDLLLFADRLHPILPYEERDAARAANLRGIIGWVGFDRIDQIKFRIVAINACQMIEVAAIGI